MKYLGDKNAPVKGWVDGVDLDENTIEQARAIARLPMIYKYVALMPDAHLGKGSTVGSVIPTQGALIPSAVGVDIGCGMISQRVNHEVIRQSIKPEELLKIRQAIEAAVPHGRSDNGQRNDIGAWGGPTHPLPTWLSEGWIDMDEKDEYEDIIAQDPELEHKRALGHLGTLGTGNHFIELETDEENKLWITIHSGSRGPGARIGNVFMKRAKELMKRFYIKLENADLSYFPIGTKEFDGYFKALQWAQGYASRNRLIMMELTLQALQSWLPNIKDRVEEPHIHCHHNYARIENHFGQNVYVTRKGAISARAGELGIIPGSMGAKTFIVEGLGNKESFMSASHGAGRKMSRKAARTQFSVEDHKKATLNIECLKDESVIDETPMAYKDIDAVMAAQSDLVKVIHTLKPLIVVKGAGIPED